MLRAGGWAAHKPLARHRSRISYSYFRWKRSWEMSVTFVAIWNLLESHLHTIQKNSKKNSPWRRQLLQIDPWWFLDAPWVFLLFLKLDDYYRASDNESSWNFRNLHHDSAWCAVSPHDATWVLTVHSESFWCMMNTHELWCIVSPHDASWVTHHDSSWRIASLQLMITQE